MEKIIIVERNGMKEEINWLGKRLKLTVSFIRQKKKRKKSVCGFIESMILFLLTVDRFNLSTFMTFLKAFIIK